MNNLGVEIGGNFVSFVELRSDVQACYRKGMGSNFCFLPETVEALLDYIAAQQSVQPTVLTAFENRHLFCPLCGGEFDVDLPASHSG